MSLDYFITLIFLLLAAKSNILSNSDVFWFLFLAFMLIIAISKKLLIKNDVRAFAFFSIFYLVYVFLRNILVNHLGSEFITSDVLFLFKFVLISFMYCVLLKDKALEYIVKVITHLTIISLFFYFFQVIGLGKYIYQLGTTLNLSFSTPIPGYTNFIIFTYTQGLHDFRNSGFVWEPGAFGCFLVIALMFNFFLNNFTFDKKANILIVGILTTLSTTNYLALFVLLFLAYRYRVPKVNIWVILLIPISVCLVVFIPFLGQKIMGVYYEDMDGLTHLKDISDYHRHYNQSIHLNRFASMVYLYNTLGNYLILGLSNKYDVVINKIYDVNLSNGIFDFFAKFGVVGFIYLIYCYSKLCYAYVKRNEYVIYCILVLLMLSFGEPILFLPLTLTFLFLPFCNTNLHQVITFRNNKYLIPVSYK